MKKILLSLMCIISFNVWALTDRTAIADTNQKGCQAYCDSLKRCCEQQTVGQINQLHCDERYEECLAQYTNTPSNQCPELEQCN